MTRPVLILVGGRSTEHDSSLLSYVGILNDMDKRPDHGLEITAVCFISRDGRAYLHRRVPWPRTEQELETGEFVTIGTLVNQLADPSSAFILNLLHGNEGEDGAWQGLAEVAALTGSFGSVFAANVTMNKWAQSILATAVCQPRLRQPNTWRITPFSSSEDLERIVAGLNGRRCVVKPNRMGASLLTECYESLTVDKLMKLRIDIAEYDPEILVQEYISGTEYTCGCIERDGRVVALPVIQVETARGFLGHQEKVRKGLVQPRVLKEDTPVTSELKEISCRLFRALDLLGMCRFDYIVSEEGVPYYLEANSIPGLMPGSAFPTMLASAGLDRCDLVRLLIDAVEHRGPRKKLLPYTIEVKNEPSKVMRPEPTPRSEGAARVFIFPTAEQWSILTEIAPSQNSPVVVITPAAPPVPPPPGIQLVSERAFPQWTGAGRDDIWLCCHERAIYFAAHHRHRAGILPFDPVCLDMLTKLDMAARLGEIGVPLLPKISIAEFLKHPQYPVIVKPNLGFASTLVKCIHSAAEMDNYLTRYDKIRRSSILVIEQQNYFPDGDSAFLEQLLVEPYVPDGVFLSIPFIARPEGLVAAFPVIGRETTSNAETDFFWTGFQAPARLPADLLRAIEENLDRLSRTFARTETVFEAEILIDQRNKTPWVLEFSPRITGGSIPRLLYHALGIDLNRYLVDQALGKKPPIPVSTHERNCSLARRHAEAAPPDWANGCVLEQLSKNVGGRQYIDEVRLHS